MLTGDDTMVKVGAKKAALFNGDPVLKLSGFANNEEITDQEINKAEEYLVRVWSGTRKATVKTVDLLLVEYYNCYSQGIHGLAPTSSIVKGLIHRGAFSLRHKYSVIGVMESFQEDSPEENEWHVLFGM